MLLKEELIRYLDAGYPILYINSFEEIKTDRIIRKAVGGRKVLEWNGAVGFCDFDTKVPIIEDLTLNQTLSLLMTDDELDRKLLVLKDVVSYLDEPEITAKLKYICHSIENGTDTGIIIVAADLKMPKELEKYITILEMSYLTEDEIASVITNFVAELEQQESIGPALMEKMKIAFKGLSEYEIENLLASSISTFGRFTEESLGLILEQKRQMIMKSNILEMVNVKEKIDDIGGLENMKKWLGRKASVFRSVAKAREYGVDMPKGVLIAGIPGCGKSLAAKATSALFKVPLLRLDMGRIMGMYLGESEKNMQKALSLSEAISPCVLWVDELEKAFAGASGSGHEVTIRLFGTLLTWLQEKTSPVFVLATANDISQLPSELLRKGRFDDIFYVDLPNLDERKKIIEIHIKKRRKQDLTAIDIDTLAGKSNGFSGADIESAIVEAIECSFSENKSSVTTKDLERVFSETKSISMLMGDGLKKIREYYKNSNFKNAT